MLQAAVRMLLGLALALYFDTFFKVTDVVRLMLCLL